MANTTLSEVLSSWRNTNQGHQGLLSKLSIDGKIYDIKDPALEALATEIESRLSTQENKTIREAALTKDANAGKFATSVTQGVDGQISVTYSDFTGLTDTAVAHQFVTKVDQGTDGEITVTRGGVKDTDVELDTATLTALGLTGTQSVSSALTGMQGGMQSIIGQAGDLSSANTIYGAKKYADEAVAALAGQDWEQNAKKVQEIIAELEDSENGNAWLTAIDKLAGMSINKTSATAAEAAEHNEGLEGAIKAGVKLTAAQASAVNGALSTSYAEGDTISTNDSIAYNATLTGAIAAGTVNWTDTNVTVKEYVDAKFAEAESAASGGISDLDAEIYGGSNGTSTGDAAGYTADTTSKVAVKLTEVDGVITAVNVKVNDVASASDLTTLDNAAIKSVNGVARAANDTTGAITLTGEDIHVSTTDSTAISTAITDLSTNKANKAAIATGSVNNWAAPTYASETLTWTNTATNVYIPGTGSL